MDARPVFLNLLLIRQPITAVVSIAHRLSGMLLFLAIPVVLYLLEQSLSSPQGFADAAAFLDGGWVKLALVILSWALAHHFAAGIRFLFLDMDIGIDLASARCSSAWVLAGGALGALLGLVAIL